WTIAAKLTDLEEGADNLAPASATASEATGPATTRAVDDIAEEALSRRRFLIVEDEPLVALEISGILKDAGAEIIGPAGTVEQALAFIRSDTPLDGALLDGNLHGLPVDDIAAALTRRNIPFVFVSGYGRETLPRAFQQAPLLSKPFSETQLLQAAARLIVQAPEVLPLRKAVAGQISSSPLAVDFLQDALRRN